MTRRFLPVCLVLVLAACTQQHDRPGSVDAVAAMPPRGLPAEALAALRPMLAPGAEVRVHERFGVPTFLWASPRGAVAGLVAARPAALSAAGAAGRETVEAVARAHLATFAPLYGLGPADLASAEVSDVHDTGRGAIVVRFVQKVDGVEVFRERASVVMDRQQRLVALAGFLSAGAAPALAASAPRLGVAEAVAAAYGDLTGEALAGGDLSGLGAREGGYQAFGLPDPTGRARPLAQPARARPIWFHGPGGLVPAFYVEVEAVRARGSDWLAYAVSALDGTVLFRHDLTADQASNVYAYRVWAAAPNDPQNPAAPFDGPQGNAFDPHPTGTLDGTQFSSPAALNDVSLAQAPWMGDPWLPIGATETTGNNVEAYADLVLPDGFTPASADFHADLTGPNAFARSYDAAQPNTPTSMKAALVQMFYNVNFFHDWYYLSGFDEAAGNAQASNYGRGGVAGDSIRAEGQDVSGRNNANMSTPADGGRPRMQMFLFDGIAERHASFTPQGGGTVDFASGVPSGWGIAAGSAYDVTGEVVWVTDGVGSATYPPATTTTATVHDGCDYTPGAGGAGDPAWAAVTGKIAFIDRGGTIAAPATCGFSDKAFNATRAGAIAVIIASTTTHAAASAITMGATAGSGVTTIPAIQLGTPDGDALRASFQAGTPVTAHLTRAAAIDRDGTVDNQIMAHEWGHYISNRLVANSSGLTTNHARGLGEGWADFHAMLLTVKEEDAQVPSNSSFGGVYALANWTSTGGSNGPLLNQGNYFGIRRMPYSTDFTKNNQTFKNIQDSSAVPVGVPFAFWPAPNTTAVNGGNSEVHNTGEIWATMLWECYAGILRDTLGPTPRLTFSQARDRMKDYLVAAYKATPAQPTLLEARDAVLAAAYAGGDLADYGAFLTAFAKRGAGLGAVSPDRYSTNNNGVVESFVSAPTLTFVSASLDDSITRCDGDGVLDSGETGLLTVTLRNDSPGQLAATTATVSAVGGNAANVTFPAGNTLAFGVANPLETMRATVQVSLAAGLSGVQQLDFQIAASDPALALPPPPVTWTARGNLDDVAGQAVVDDAESGRTVWTTLALGTAGAAGWVRKELSATDHNYAVADPNGVTDVSLVSPNLVVGAAGNLGVTFKQRYAFEASGATLFDGGVLELTTDNGNTWSDVGGLASAGGYTGALAGGSPLGTRRAWGGISPGYPAYLTTTVDLGTSYAGKTVKVRFRAASDSNGRAAGWEVDDIGFQGLANRPFAALLANKCAANQGNRAPTAAITAAGPFAERTAQTVAGTGTDLDGDALAFTWTQVSGPPVVLTPVPPSSVSFTAPEVPVAGGAVVLGLLAFDGTAYSALATRSFSITNVDRPPTVDAGPAQAVDEGTLVLLAGSAADPDGDPLAYAWTQVSGPAVALAGADTAAPAFVAPQVAAAGATLGFQLLVTAGGVTAQAATTVQVRNVNHPPTADAGAAQTVDAKTLVQLHGKGLDPDGDPVTFQWTQRTPATPAVSLSSASDSSPTFTAPDVAADTAFVFDLAVSDGIAALPTTASVTVNVKHVAPPSGGGNDGGGKGGCSSGGAAELWSLALLALGLGRSRRRRDGERAR